MAMRFLNGPMTTLSLLQGQAASCLKTLFRLRYWTRTWIIQEIVLAKKSTLYYDDLKLEWSRIEELHADLERNRPPGYEHILQTQPLKLVQQISNYVQGTLRLSNLLEAHFSTACTDPRDKVYAVLGLAQDYQRSPSFEIDYQKDVQDIFREVICFCAVPDLEVPKFAYLLRRSLGLLNKPDNSNVVMTQAYFGKQSMLKELWSRRRYGRNIFNGQLEKSPHFLPCDGVRLGSIYDSNLADPLSALDQLYNHRYKSNMFWSFIYAPSKEEILEMCSKSAYQASPANIPLFNNLDADCRNLETLTSWHRNPKVRGLNSLRLQGLGLKFVIVRFKNLTSDVFTLGLAPLHAADGNAIIKFYGYPRLFFADAELGSPLLGAIFIHEKCGVKWEKLDALFLALSQWEMKFARRTTAVLPSVELNKFLNLQRGFMMSFSEILMTFY
jgi:hypothetical protein